MALPPPRGDPPEGRTDTTSSTSQSKNGTLLNGQPVKDERRLRDGRRDHPGRAQPDLLRRGGRGPGRRSRRGRASSPSASSATSTRSPPSTPRSSQRQNRVLSILSKAASELVVHRPLNELFDLVLDLLFEAVPAERGAILAPRGRSPAPCRSRPRAAGAGGSIAQVSRSIARRVLEDRVSLLLPNIMEDARFRAEQSILASGIRSAMCAPLWFSPGGSGKDMVIGLVYLDTLQHAHSFGEEDLRILTALANVAAAKIENVRLLEESLEKRRMEEDMKMAAEIQVGPPAAGGAQGRGLRARGLEPPLPHGGGRLLRLRRRGPAPPPRPGRRVREGHGGRSPHDRPAGGGARTLDGAQDRGGGQPDQPHGVPERPRPTST